MTHAAIQSLATLSLACMVILAIFSRLMELKVVQAHILKSTSICLYTSITEGFLEVMAEREICGAGVIYLRGGCGLVEE